MKKTLEDYKQEMRIAANSDTMFKIGLEAAEHLSLEDAMDLFTLRLLLLKNINYDVNKLRYEGTKMKTNRKLYGSVPEYKR